MSAAPTLHGVKAGTVVLVGCGQMGSAMLRGWLASEAAERFLVIEPAGGPAALANAPAVAWYRAAEGLSPDNAPDAVFFAVKPQIIDALLPDYRRWVRPETLRLARETVAGAGELALVSPDSPARLRENVTSPGGTTRAALDVLMAEHGLPELLDRAVAAATARSRELAN